MNQVPPPVPRTNAAAVTNVRLPPHIANAILKARGKEGLKQYLVAQMQAKPTRPANTSNTQQTSTVFNHPQPQTVAKRPAPKTNEADKPHHKRPRIKQKVGTVCNDRDIIISELTKTPTFHIFMKMPYEILQTILVYVTKLNQVVVTDKFMYRAVGNMKLWQNKCFIFDCGEPVKVINETYRHLYGYANKKKSVCRICGVKTNVIAVGSGFTFKICMSCRVSFFISKSKAKNLYRIPEEDVDKLETYTIGTVGSNRKDDVLIEDVKKVAIAKYGDVKSLVTELECIKKRGIMRTQAKTAVKQKKSGQSKQ